MIKIHPLVKKLTLKDSGEIYYVNLNNILYTNEIKVDNLEYKFFTRIMFINNTSIDVLESEIRIWLINA